jgi:hypothetical protein
MATKADIDEVAVTIAISRIDRRLRTNDVKCRADGGVGAT